MFVSGFILALTGTVIYTCLFITGKRIVMRFLFHRNTKHDILDITNKSVSAIHAIFSCTAGFVVTWNCVDIKYDKHWMTNAFAWFGFPYFVYDVFCMFYVFRQLPQNEKEKQFWPLFFKFLLFQPVIIAHHLILAFLGLPAIVHFRGDIGDYYIGCFYLAELSTPFVSIRAVLSKLNLKNNVIYKVNGLVMIVLFFICRVCLFPFLYCLYARYANITISQVTTHIPKKCNVGSFIFVVFQLYWFVVMVKGAVKVFGKKTSSSTFSNSHSKAE